MGQEQDVAQQPQAPFYDLRPAVPQQPPSVPYQTGEESPAPPFLRENTPYQSAETLQQPQPYERLGKPENIEVPPYMQHQTATQRIPRYQQSNVQQDNHDLFSQKNVNATPTQTTEQSDVSQPSFQRFNSIPSVNQQAEIPVQPPPAVPSAPSAPQAQGPFAQMPPEPIPPPSVTSPPPTGAQKKPAIIDEDEEEQFGPSNFGLDF
jgi:hypothetical protein